MSDAKKPGRVGTVARCKPVTIVHQAVLESLCDIAEHAVIGIGSSNLYDARNPFTAEETENMIRLALKGRANYEILRAVDYGNGPLWKANTVKLFGELDAFVTANEYVKNLLKDDYRIIHTAEIIPKDRQMPISGTIVREAMASGGKWQEMVPDEVAEYLEKNGLVERFRREFGLETIALRGGYVIQPRKVDTHG